jgi:uncharacterized membrane protein YGL010W
MKSLKEQMVAYAAYHRHPKNKISHFFGVPLAIVSLLTPLAWFRFAPAPGLVSGATLLYVCVMVYYVVLDRRLAAVVAVVALPLLWAAERLGTLPFGQSAAAFLAVTIVGWAIQLLGHHFEGRRPALTDNLLQIFNAPLFVVLEVYFMLGLRRSLKADVDAAVARDERQRGLAVGKESAPSAFHRS